MSPPVQMRPPSGLPARAALGFVAGVRAFFGGIAFVTRTPSTWGWAMVPIVIGAALFVAFGASAIYGASRLATSILSNADPGSLATISLWMLRVVFGAVALLLAFLVAMALAQPLSGFALEAIVKQQQRALGGRDLLDPPVLESLGRSLRVTLTALALALPILGVLAVVTVLVPPLAVVTVPLKLVVAGLLLAYDFLDYPLSLRGVGVRDRLAFIRKNAASVLGLGLSASVFLLVPGMGLVLLPWGAAAAARLVHESEVGGPTRA